MSEDPAEYEWDAAELRQSAYESGRASAVDDQRTKIEALRAAAVVAWDKTNPNPDDVAANTIFIAEQFRAWLSES